MSIVSTSLAHRFKSVAHEFERTLKNYVELTLLNKTGPNLSMLRRIAYSIAIALILLTTFMYSDELDFI